MLIQTRSLRPALIILSLLLIIALLDLSRSKSYISDHVQSQLYPSTSSPAPPDPVSEALDGQWKENFKTVEAFNEVSERSLEECKSGSGPCRTNQGKVVLLAWGHFKKVLFGGMQGENVWCDAMMDAMHALGYSLLLAEDTPHLYDLWRRHHANVQLIIWENYEWGSQPCLRNSTCLYAPPGLNLPVPPPNSTHLNIPIWKIFHANWWNGPVPPLGGPFTISPEPYDRWPNGNNNGKDNFYVGYSLEKTCLKTPFTPYAQRPRQAYVFAKYLHFFMEPNYILPDPQGIRENQLKDDFYANLARTDNITWLGQFRFDGIPKGLHHPPLGVTQIGRMARPAFQRVVGESRVLLGIGRPALSPTPYEALCLGVPFINPIRRWDAKDPDNIARWDLQHDGLLYTGIGEPYVYHVKIGDRAGFERAVKKAMETPIERFIPPHMTMSALIDRMKVLLETDWRPAAITRMEATQFVLSG